MTPISTDAEKKLASFLGELQALINRYKPMDAAAGAELRYRSCGVAPRAAAVRLIVEEVAAETHMLEEDIDQSAKLRRGAQESMARHMAMTLAREYTGMTLRAVANYFGLTDHSSVNLAVKKIQFFERTYPDVAATMKKLRQRVPARLEAAGLGRLYQRRRA